MVHLHDRCNNPESDRPLESTVEWEPRTVAFACAATIAESVDVYPKPEEVCVLTITTLSVNTLLGLTLSDDDMARVLTRAQFTFEKSDVGFVVRIPPLRLDLRITEDMIEEIGRHVGYEQIQSIMPTIATKGIPNMRLYYANKVRTFLIEKGYSEVYTYSFAKPKEGEIEVMHPVGKDRPFIRHALTTGITKSLESNLYWSALLATDAVKIFELGNVFPVSGEHTALALGVITSNKKQFARMKDENVATYHEVVVMLGLPKQEMVMQTPDIIEIDFDALIKDLPEPSAYVRIFRGQDTGTDRARRHRCDDDQGPRRAAHPRSHTHAGARNARSRRHKERRENRQGLHFRSRRILRSFSLISQSIARMGSPHLSLVERSR